MGGPRCLSLGWETARTEDRLWELAGWSQEVVKVAEGTVALDLPGQELASLGRGSSPQELGSFSEAWLGSRRVGVPRAGGA